MNPIKADDFDDRTERLIGYHMGLLSAEERAEVEAMIGSDPSTQDLSEQIAQTLGPLSEYEVPVPEGLDQRILLAVQTPALSVEGFLNEHSNEGPTRRRIFFSRMVDFVATAAAVLMISSALFMYSGHLRQQSQKTMCASNLGAIGMGIASYARDHSEQLPFAATAANPPWYDRETHQTRRAHLFILVKGDYVSPQVLICSADRSVFEELSKKDLVGLDDFPAGTRISYSFQNLFGDERFDPKHRRRRWEQAEHMAIMADRTPLFKDNQLVSSLDFDNVFSPNHSKLKGQNILTLDGRVVWQTSPLFGPEQDNIWQAGDIEHYSGTETPVDATDSFLAP